MFAMFAIFHSKVKLDRPRSCQLRHVCRNLSISEVCEPSNPQVEETARLDRSFRRRLGAGRVISLGKPDDTQVRPTRAFGGMDRSGIYGDMETATDEGLTGGSPASTRRLDGVARTIMRSNPATADFSK